tara:strand:- start:204822 stop:206009 length:1188 start_codon:yes stop_codon:yes gene_type:complete
MSDMTTLYNTQATSRAAITRWTDSYFTNTAKCVESDGESMVTYAVFIRSPSMFAPKMAAEWLKEVAKEGGFNVKLESKFEPGDFVPSGEPQFYISAPLSKMAECETLFLQKVGAVAVAALNAYNSCIELPDTPFIAMGARHCVGMEMQEMMDYAASVGSEAAIKNKKAQGFINGASNATSHFFGKSLGTGTMPHALIGYYGATLPAAQAFRKQCPDKPFTVLVDFNGKEISDAIEVAQHFPKEAADGTLGFRLDTHGGRYLEGLDHQKSIDVLNQNAPGILSQNWDESEEKILIGPGVSVANIWHFKNELAKAGFPNVGCIGSSGFGPKKCRIMNLAKAPLTGVGTGSYIPKDFDATYATADIFEYDGDYKIKVGREYLGERYKESRKASELKIL